MDEDRARRHGRHSELGGHSSGGGADFISILPDDVIILILVRLHCTRAAARTGILSHRWRGLWTRLPGLVFRDVAPGLLLAALSSLGPRRLSLSLLEIHVPAAVHDKEPATRISLGTRSGLRSSARRREPTNYVSSLLHAAARLSPAELRFNHPHPIKKPFLDVNLSNCFHRATSIELRAPFLCFPGPQSNLPSLQSLSLYGCRISLVALLPLCPRLNVLRVTDAFLPTDDIVVCSASLEEIIMENNVGDAWTRRVHIEVPMLKQFTMLLRAGGDLSVSVSAPLMEKVSWRCLYSGAIGGLGVWGLCGPRLETEKSNGQQGEDVPRVNVLCLHMFARLSRRRGPLCHGDGETYDYRLLWLRGTSQYAKACVRSIYVATTWNASDSYCYTKP